MEGDAELLNDGCADGRIEEGDDVGDSVDGAALGRMVLRGDGPIEGSTVGL